MSHPYEKSPKEHSAPKSVLRTGMRSNWTDVQLRLKLEISETRLKSSPLGKPYRVRTRYTLPPFRKKGCLSRDAVVVISHQILVNISLFNPLVTRFIITLPTYKILLWIPSWPVINEPLYGVLCSLRVVWDYVVSVVLCWGTVRDRWPDKDEVALHGNWDE